MIAFLVATALASPSAADVQAAIAAELDRVSGLQLPDHGPPHHVLVRATHGWEADASASFGALIDVDIGPRDALKVEVRAGTPEFDSTGFTGQWRQQGFESTGIADVPTTRAVREQVWRWVDHLYKAGVTNLAHKEGVRTELDDDDHLDWEVRQPVVREVDGPTPPPPEPDVLADRVRALSAAVRGRELLRADAALRLRAGHRIVVATDGTAVRVPDEYARMRLELEVRADDGVTKEHTLWWSGRTLADLPSASTMAGEAVAAVDLLDAWRTAPVLEEPWYGPVLLLPPSAARVLRSQVVRRLQGTPGVVEFRPWQDRLERPDDRTVPPGTRVLPRGWTVVDDPSHDPGGPCCPVVDDEGVVPTRVTLVDDGVVDRHLMTRTPSAHFGSSTGHASTMSDKRCEARATFVSVTPPRRQSAAGIRKAALTIAKRSGVDRVLVLGTLQGLGHWLFADGHTEPVRGYSSQEFDVRSLRGMTTAGPSESIVWPSGRLHLEVPTLLLDNLALTPDTDAKREPPPRRRSPLVAR